MIDKFITLTTTAVPLKIENVDTDQIIPARFLKATTKEGFGKQLFYDWRFDSTGKPKSDFVLNSPVYGGSILVAGKNFGCGSSPGTRSVGNLWRRLQSRSFQLLCRHIQE